MAQFRFGNLSLLMSAILFTGAVGCGGSAGDGFSGERGQVSGTITLGGSPLKEGCQVIFMSATGGYTASGVVKADGKYTLVYSDSSGLPAAEYLVQLTAPVVPDSTTTVDPTQMAAKMNLSEGVGVETANSGPFPLKYASTTTSDLKFKVEAGQNTADFKLEAGE